MFEGWKAKKLVSALAANPPAAGADEFRALGDRGVDALIEALRHPQPAVRAGAARVLGELAPPRALGPLAACAGDAPEAASALTAILSRSVRPRVFHALKGKSGPAALVALLTASDEAKRSAAEAALLAGDAACGSALAAALEIEELREPALRLLARTGPQAAAAVVPLLAHARKEVRRQAAAALRSYGWNPSGPAEEAALAAAEMDWRRCRELGEAGTERLIALLADADSDVRQAAARGLAALKDPRAVPPLVAALDDRKEAVRLAAVDALGEIGDRAAAQPLLERLRGSYDLRGPALDALRRIGWTPATAADTVLHAVLTGDKTALAAAPARRLLVQAASEQDYSALPEEVVLGGLAMLENADAELLQVLRHGGRPAETVRDILNRRRPPGDLHLLCPRCQAYLGTTEHIRAGGGHAHCGQCGAPVRA